MRPAVSSSLCAWAVEESAAKIATKAAAASVRSASVRRRVLPPPPPHERSCYHDAPPPLRTRATTVRRRHCVRMLGRRSGLGQARGMADMERRAAPHTTQAAAWLPMLWVRD